MYSLGILTIKRFSLTLVDMHAYIFQYNYLSNNVGYSSNIRPH